MLPPNCLLLPRRYGLYLAMMVVMLVCDWCQPEASQWFQFDRSKINNGEYWRLFTASWVHLSHNHLLGNMLAVGLLAYIAGPYLNNRIGVMLSVWAVLWVGVGLYGVADYLQYYVGLSGALHGFLFVAPFISPFYSRRAALIFASIIVIKVLWEQSSWYNEMALATFIGGRVETKSHLLGALSGIAFLSLLRVFKPAVLQAGKTESQHR